MHVLGHLKFPGESVQSSEPSSFGGIERDSLSSRDDLFPCDHSRHVSPSSHPSTSLVLSVVAYTVLDGAFPGTRPFSRVCLIRHVSWRVLHGVSTGGRLCRGRWWAFSGQALRSTAGFVAGGGERRRAAVASSVWLLGHRRGAGASCSSPL